MATIITLINMGRVLTSAEQTTRNNALTEAIAAGTGNETFASSGPGTPAIKIWSTTDAANAWVAMHNTFSPPPVSAVVQTL